MQRIIALPFALLVLAAACADEKDPPATGQDATAGIDRTVNDDASVLPDGGEPDPDAGEVEMDSGVRSDSGATAREPTCPASAEWITEVSGTLVDETGAPSVGSKAQLCVRVAPTEILLCLRPSDSDETGYFAISVPGNARCMDKATMRMVRPLADRAASYCALDIDAPNEWLNVARPLPLFATRRATTLPPKGTGDNLLTVAFPNGLELDVVPNKYFPGAGTYEELAAETVQVDSNDACTLAGEAPFDGVIAFSPEGDFHDRAAVRIPNTQNLPANSAVNIYVLGGIGCTNDQNEDLPEGKWTQIEGGTVSADGTTINVTPGLPCLSWVAYRRP
jgi:hypothetical protein